MAIKAYSLAKNGSKKLSANFAVKEFRCKDGTDPIFIDDALVKLLQNIQKARKSRICWAKTFQKHIGLPHYHLANN